MSKYPIGIFDSGVGGLTVLREIERVLPHEDIVYFGDTARVPYGNKSPETIIKFSTENILFLLRKKVKMVIVACNTASALALDYVSGIFNVPVFGVIEAGAQTAVNTSHNKRIGIIGTRSTILSNSYERAMREKDAAVRVFSQCCPLLVPLVEEGIVSGELVRKTLTMYLQPMKTKKIDTLILGCTHYPLLKPEISRYMRGVTVIDSAQAVAVHTQEVLAQYNFFNERAAAGKREFYVSDEPYGFAKLAKFFLKRDIEKPKVVSV